MDPKYVTCYFDPWKFLSLQVGAWREEFVSSLVNLEINSYRQRFLKSKAIEETF